MTTSLLDSPPVRRSRHLTFAPPAPADLDELHRLLNDPAVAAGWRCSGRDVPIASMPRVLADGVALSLACRDAGTGRLVGLVEIVDLDEAARAAQLCVALDPEVHGSGLLLEAVAIVVDEAFDRLPLRKVYAMMTAETHRSVRGGLVPLVREGIVTHEGTLLGHRPAGTTWHDVVVLGIWPGPLRTVLASGHPLARISADRWRLAP